MDLIISEVASKLTTTLTKPEDVIIEHFDNTTDMYIIAKGECAVILINDTNKNHSTHSRILRAGDYFGEIALIYGC